MFTIRHTDLEGKHTDFGQLYTKESTATLAANWFTKRQNKTWRVVNLEEDYES